MKRLLACLLVLCMVIAWAPLSVFAVENPFTDVPEGKYYTDPILWAFSNGITTGKTDTTFEPNEACTRGQIVTFLWRALGEPEPATKENPFTDVNSSAYYYKAVLWAFENGITTGKTDTTFEPKGPCTRAQVVTFLWRTMDKPAHNQSNPFSDIPGGKYYTNAVLWALENGITTGKTATTFLPDDTCTRAQIVTFLYRALVESGNDESQGKFYDEYMLAVAGIQTVFDVTDIDDSTLSLQNAYYRHDGEGGYPTVVLECVVKAGETRVKKYCVIIATQTKEEAFAGSDKLYQVYGSYYVSCITFDESPYPTYAIFKLMDTAKCIEEYQAATFG